MSSRIVVVVICTLVSLLALTMALVAAAQVIELEQISPGIQTASDPITLNINLGTEPPTLDPALASDATSANVIEQLFIGLVDLDDDTGEVQPELATGWTVSPDGAIYTFALRSDVTWSDGTPLTAGDVRYGILRTLYPATAANYAYPLYVIKNGMGYNSGSITDPNEVGVTAVDSTTLRVELEYPASHVLSILSMWMARPMPQWAIEDHGVPTWTEPANIVTSGPYRLSQWVHDSHITLHKNPTYYDAPNAQIEQVKMWMETGATTAWQMYLDGELDTVGVPIGAELDPVLSQQLHTQPRACTYYYGYSVSQAPFDDPLVRQAFSAASNRRGLVDWLGGGQQPALTFTPPGIFGHIDGYAEDIGIPYNPSQAQQWLADAGYPNGQGLPPITLWFNTSTGHQALAEQMRDNWSTTLGVSVTLQSLPWGDYLDRLGNGELQIWRGAWCADYSDANSCLNDGLERSRHGDWYDATYDDLVIQAAQEQDPDTRKVLYKQAEEILVESDAVMMPLYYYASNVATKPYLERTYPAIGAYDIAKWRITWVQETIGPDGGGLTSYDGDTTYQFPAGSFTDTVVITHTPASGMPPESNLVGIDHVFDVTAIYSNTGQPAQPAPGQTYTVTVQYTDAEKGPALENTLALYWWNGDTWSQQGIASSVNITDNLVAAQVGHFSIFTVLGETRRVYLPLVLRDR